jgi:hypothetical protein
MASTKTASRKSSGRASTNGGAKRSQSKSRSNSRATTKRRTTSSSKQRARPVSGVDKAVGTAKDVGAKAKAPALAIGAGAAGLAGGLVLTRRTRRKTVLGVPVPRSLRPGVDVKSIAKTVGQTSQRVAKTSKAVSRDIERAGDKAERIGKILS